MGFLVCLILEHDNTLCEIYTVSIIYETVGCAMTHQADVTRRYEERSAGDADKCDFPDERKTEN